MVDDPSSYPDLFPTEKAQEKERQRLFRIIEDLVQWANTTNEEVLQRARDEIWRSWRRACAEHADHPRAGELFDRNTLPAFHDPFAGGGALPLEAQRLGLESYASDLNQGAVLINNAMIEIPPKFAGREPINPDWQAKSAEERSLRKWGGAQGLAEDIRYYGQWMRDEAEKRIGYLYPKIEVTATMAQERPDLRKYIGRKLNVIAWLWARTVKSPNPAFAEVDVPLAATFMLSTKLGKEAYVEPVIKDDSYCFMVKVGKPNDRELFKNGTKLARGANFRCLMSGAPMESSHIKNEGKAGRMGARLMAIVADGDRGRVYLSPTPEMETVARSAVLTSDPEGSFVEDARAFTPCIYGLKEWRHLFTARQLVALTTFSDLIPMAREQMSRDALAAGVGDVTGYSNAVSVYLAFALSKQADLGSNLCAWEPIAQCPRHVFGRQAIPMVWDFAEGNPLGNSSGAWSVFIESIAKSFSKAFEFVPTKAAGSTAQVDARRQEISKAKVVSTDPPYYDNVPYADLSDFFYVWMRRSLKSVFPDLFATLSVPKTDELVAFAYRHESKAGAEAFFLDGMTEVMHRLAENAHPAFPVTIYYAFKQSESRGGEGISSTGWETFLDAVISAGFATSGTWPIRTENDSRLRGQSSNALATSVVLVCRKRPAEAPVVTRREFVATLQKELPLALAHLQRGNIAPVDLAQAAIGPGMAVYTRFRQVLDAEGKPLTVREALSLINQVLDETLAEQEGDFDADSRWAITWFDQHGFTAGEFGIAETLSKAKNTSVGGLVEAGIIESKGGKVRLLKPDELDPAWDPAQDGRLTAWEMVHHLIRALESGGDEQAAVLAGRLGGQVEVARELCYRLYTLCERRKRAAEALSYNGLVRSFPEILQLAGEQAAAAPTTPQQTSFI